jgi:hypothetical protein
MPSLSTHHSSSLVKLLLIGDPKSGKTTALTPLVTDLHLKLRILDLDNLLDPFASRIRRSHPELLDHVEYRTVRDRYKSSPTGTILDGKPSAWIDSLKMLDSWRYDDVDLGSPAAWGPECVLVIDSLSRWCDAAYNFYEAITPKGKSGEADGRAVYGNTQDGIERALALLTAPNFATNVIVICHGTHMDLPDGTVKIFPQGVGQKLSPKIPQYFPNYIRMTKRGEKRTMQLKSDSLIDLANNLPPQLATSDLDPDTGLATFFQALRDQPVETGAPTSAKPKSVTLVRRS